MNIKKMFDRHVRVEKEPIYQKSRFGFSFEAHGNCADVQNMDLKREILSSPDWYNPIELDGEMVSLKSDWMKDFHYYRYTHVFENLIKKIETLKGKSILDIGCNEGYYAFAALQLGASYVKGIDLRQINVDRANWIKQYYGYDNCEFEVGNIEDSDFIQVGKFDLVFCFGVLYHLENPMLSIRNLRDITGSILVVDSALTSFDMHPLIRISTEPKENLRAGRTGVALYPSLGGLIKMLQCGGFEVERLPTTEPAFWSKHCGHDYRKNQVTFFCN